MLSREKKARGTAEQRVVEMAEIFKPHEEGEKPRKVLIEGKPGMGKTTYCNKVAYDWATKKHKAEDYFPEFELLLLLKCRDVAIGSDLWDAIDDQLLPREVQAEEREKFFKFISQNQSKVLLVFDGLDELPTSKLPKSFSEVISGKTLPRCYLVVTARNEAGIAVRKDCDALLEVEGFSPEDAKEFILKYLKGKEDMSHEFLKNLSIDSRLEELTANPLNTALLCLIFEDFQGKLPQRRTQLYLKIVQCVLIRYRKKKGLSVDIKDVIEIYEDQLKLLGSIALNGTASLKIRCTLRKKSFQVKMPTYLNLAFCQLNLEAANEDRVCATALRIRVLKNSSQGIIFVASLLAKKPVPLY